MPGTSTVPILRQHFGQVRRLGWHFQRDGNGRRERQVYASGAGIAQHRMHVVQGRSKCPWNPVLHRRVPGLYLFTTRHSMHCDAFPEMLDLKVSLPGLH
mmetsp:Transcript_26004/g.83958  ORF Transcript_26004/g.83958 Transcript_26004/m.83958 type:complete len:99 (+) Transcript_26004:2738-3034(+)